jgi:hypothetical protein
VVDDVPTAHPTTVDNILSTDTDDFSKWWNAYRVSEIYIYIYIYMVLLFIT